MRRLIVIALLSTLLGAPVRAQTNVTGSFYHGDGLGKNLVIEIATDGAYAAKWTDCLGVCGSATGIWSRSGAVLTLAPSVETGMFKEHPLHDFQILSATNLLIRSPSNAFNGKTFDLKKAERAGGSNNTSDGTRQPADGLPKPSR